MHVYSESMRVYKEPRQGFIYKFSEGAFMELRGGPSLALSPVSLIVSREARSMLHAGKSWYPLFAHYAGFHETVNYTGRSRISSSLLIGGTNYELSQQFLVGLRPSPLRFLAFAVLVLLRTCSVGVYLVSVTDNGEAGLLTTSLVPRLYLIFHAWAGKRAWYPLFAYASKISRFVGI